MLGKFDLPEVAALRDRILEPGVDSFQAAEFIRLFLEKHGYGAPDKLRNDLMKQRIAPSSHVDVFRWQLERIAFAN